jgi:hypothetical protein
MLYEALTAAFLVVSQVAASSAPAGLEHRLSSLRSRAAEASIVGSNEILREFIDTDLWLERDVITERNATDAAFDGEAFVNNAFYTSVRVEAGIPDAEPSPRSAAASFEWPEFLRRVGYEKPASRSKQSGGRSTKGSVELLESLKKARKEKGGGK